MLGSGSIGDRIAARSQQVAQDGSAQSEPNDMKERDAL
jgi:hypothetical protein